MRKVTKVICRFIATEYDEEGNALSELPVAAGKEEFTACIFYPFGANIEAWIARIEEELNASQGTQDLQERGAGERIRGHECPSQEPASGGEEAGSEAEDLGAGGSPGWAPAEHEPRQPEGDEPQGEHQEGADGGQQEAEACLPAEGLQQEEPAILVIEPWYSVNKQSNAEYLIWESMLEDGLESDLRDAHLFVEDLKNNGDANSYVAYVGGEPAGVVVGIFHKKDANPCYEVRNLYVRPQFRSKGVAQRLMRALVDWAYEPGKSYPVYITTNGEPRPFYKALGFKPVREVCGSTLATIIENLGGADVGTEDIQSGDVG